MDDTLDSWRARIEADLRGPRGWLALAGLYWLMPGTTTLGSAATNDIVLPASAPPLLGTLTRHEQTVTLVAAVDVALRVNRVPSAGQTLRTDDNAPPDLVECGDLAFIVIVRGARVGVRLWDAANPMRTQFAGRTWFAADPAWRVVAQWLRYDPPVARTSISILGDERTVFCPGAACWQHGSDELMLEAESQAAAGVLFAFRDQTSGGETYGALRFLHAEPQQDGLIVLDFNRAVSPPCAFTDYATCPLPPPQNHLPIAIRAGERYA